MGVTNDAIRLRLFSFSLKDKAKAWLNSLLVGSISTWNMLAHKFLSKYFPLAKTIKLCIDIINFIQYDQESMYVA